MSVLIVQLSDLHATTGHEPIIGRWDALCRAVATKLDLNVDSCVIVFSGDAAYGGQAAQFGIAAGLLQQLRHYTKQLRPQLSVYLLTVPGNHDCNLISEDEEARLTLRQKVTDVIPAGSTARILLEAQLAYFNFSAQVGEPSASLSAENPYYRSFDVVAGNRRLRLHLLNSSWTSVLHESDDLRFPLQAFSPPVSPEADYEIAVMHHPVHWFLMPGVRRELRKLIEDHADLILTGHEHENEASRRIVRGGNELEYLEGGVLHEDSQPGLCTFNIIHLDFDTSQQVVTQFRWADTHFAEDGQATETSLLRNPNRCGQQFRLQPAFEHWLDELEDPLTHPRQGDLRLSHLFSYPELRKVVVIPAVKGAKATHLVEWIRSEEVLSELTAQQRTFVTGGDKSGKTSLGKSLFGDLRATGKMPLLVKGGDIAKSGSEEGFRRLVAKTVTHEYQAMTPAEYEQLPPDRRVLVIDDFQEGPVDPRARRRLLDCIETLFGSIVLIAADDLYLEQLDHHGQDAAALMTYQRFEIGEFGHVRFEEMAIRWTTLGQTDADPADLKATALELCEKVQSLLAAAGLPHTPWLLAVLLEQADSPDAATAARNGDYGHLYHAVITVALSRSHFTQFDLSGKFTYLAELAYHLHCANRPILTETEARAFHADVQARYDMPFDYGKVRDDLIGTRMLRLDGDTIAFRYRYVYAFFVAWWLSRNLHKDEAQAVLKELTGRLHHDVSADVLVFLSHLSDNPIVVTSMRTAAAALYSREARATIDDDVAALNKLNGVEGFFVLPPSSPEINRKLLQDAEDERAAKEEKRSHDGRTVRAIPVDDTEGEHEVHKELKELRAALRTIRILGQVLRNKALSTEVPEKMALMNEVLGLGRRVLGHLYGYLQYLNPSIKLVRHRLFRILVSAKTTEPARRMRSDNAPTFPNGTEGQNKKPPRLAREQLRPLWNDAGALAKRYWFDMYWLATYGMVHRLSSAVGSKLLDGTLSRINAEDNALPNRLVDLAARLHRRGRTIPADDVVRLHKDLQKSENKLGRIVLEAIACDRLLVFETDYAQKQQICKQMGIEQPAKALDLSRKKFAP